MNTQNEIRDAMTQHRLDEDHVRESMLNRSLEELDTPEDPQLQAEARARLVEERQGEHHTQVSMRKRVVEEIDRPLGLQ